MAQTSTTIQTEYTHKSNITGTDISFTATGTEYKISATSTSFSALAQYDLITVTGTTNNNSTFTVKSVASDGTYFIVEEVVTTETADGSTTFTLSVMHDGHADYSSLPILVTVGEGDQLCTPGDVNDDNSINIVDVVLLINMILM